MVNCKNCGKAFKYPSIMNKHSCKYVGSRKQKWINRIQQDIQEQKDRISNYHTKISQSEQMIQDLEKRIKDLESFTDLNL